MKIDLTNPFLVVLDYSQIRDVDKLSYIILVNLQGQKSNFTTIDLPEHFHLFFNQFSKPKRRKTVTLYGN